MRKKCADCGCEVNRNVIQGMYYCPRCDDDKREIDVLPMILFDRITVDEETLAQELVTLDCDGWWAYVGFGKRKTYPTREAAIAATVEKLKEVCDE